MDTILSGSIPGAPGAAAVSPSAKEHGPAVQQCGQGTVLQTLSKQSRRCNRESSSTGIISAGRINKAPGDQSSACY